MAVTKLIQNFRDFCRENKYKITLERIEVLREISVIRGHFDADDLLIRMKKKNRKISRATIYRTLELLVEMHILNRERLGGEQYLYELQSDGDIHYHCICRKCGKISEFSSAVIAGQVQKESEDLGFGYLHHNLKVSGFCPRCKKSK